MADKSKNEKERDKRKKLLEFIENNSAKNEFITWLNKEQNGTFSEQDNWDVLRNQILDDGAEVTQKDLRLYAASLSSEADIKDLLQDVEEQTKEAKREANKLFYLSEFRKFSIAVGGVLILEGALFGALGIGGLVGVFSFGFSAQTHISLMIVSILFGAINTVAGLLLTTR